MKVSRKLAMTIAGGLAVGGLVLGSAAPAMAGQFPTKACYANGTGSPTTGTLQGRLFSTQVNSNETTYGGQCGTVEVKAFYYVPGGSGMYEAGWVSNSTSAWSATYPATAKGWHDSTTSSPKVESWW